MGNWSPYSKEWEKQHLQKIIDGAETARLPSIKSMPDGDQPVIRAENTCL